MRIAKYPSSVCDHGRRTGDRALASAAAILGRLLTCVVVAVLLSAEGAGAEEPGNHLFILSGQSNMTGGLKAGFARTVEGAFGKESVTVALSSKSGRGIRFWDKDYQFPNNYKFPGKGAPEKKHFQQHGQLYGPLIQAARNVGQNKSYDTVTFIWMQGESDAGRGLEAVYEQSFLRLLERLKTDLKRKELNFVIGRLNDAQMSNPHWRKVRDVQVKLGDDHAHGAWIDTDDLNGGEAGKPGGAVHYPKEKIGILGERFANRALELIRKRPASDGNDIQGEVKSR